MIEKLLLKLRARDDVSEEEEEALRNAAATVREYPADRVVVSEGETVSVSLLLLEGLMCRFKDLASGGRQISALHVAGDFLDLHSFTLKSLDHSVMTLTPCRVAVFPHAALTAITERHPHLTRLLWFSTNLDAAMHREWELSLGRRNARARTAHLFCELLLRLQPVGLADTEGFPLKLTQIELAECLGLTSVHVNRVLRELREDGLMEFKSGRVTICDFDRLKALAEFRPNYLFLDKRPR